MTAFGLQSVTLGWSDSDPTVVGYDLSYGGVSGVHTNTINEGTNTTATVGGLIEGQTYYFVVASYNASGVQSAPTPELAYLVPGIVTIAPSPKNQAVQIRFPIAPGLTYALQVSSDLKNWSSVWTSPSGSSNTWVEIDEPLTNTTPQFYRVNSCQSAP